MVWLGIAVLVVIGGMLWFRLAPSDVQRWHVPVTIERDVDLTGGVGRIIDGDAAGLAAFDAAFRKEARTEILAGSVDEGRITYVSRTRFWGFPDYTTVELRDGKLYILSRLRFGVSDLGVNRQRLDRVLRRLQ